MKREQIDSLRNCLKHTRHLVGDRSALFLIDDVAAALAIIDKLPKTVDGVTVCEGDTVYRETRKTGQVEPHIVTINARAINTALSINWSLDGCYSTHEAAIAAKAVAS